MFDRSAALPPGYQLDQADGTAWVAAYALDLMRIALELARRNAVYVDIAVKFSNISCISPVPLTAIDDSAEGLSDEQDLFFYDVLRGPDGQNEPVRLRSIVGLMPLFAVLVLEQREHEGLEGLRERLLGFMKHRPDLAKLVSRWNEPGQGNRLLLALLRGERTKDLLRRMFEDSEFLSAFGVRSLSKAFAEQPWR